MVRLVVASVSSSSKLRQALSPGQADSFGEFDGETLLVDSRQKAEELIERYPNVRYEDPQPSERESETVRMEATNGGAEYVCGVNSCSRSVDTPSDTCWQHSTETESHE